MDPDKSYEDMTYSEYLQFSKDGSHPYARLLSKKEFVDFQNRLKLVYRDVTHQIIMSSLDRPKNQGVWYFITLTSMPEDNLDKDKVTQELEKSMYKYIRSKQIMSDSYQACLEETKLGSYHIHIYMKVNSSKYLSKKDLPRHRIFGNDRYFDVQKVKDNEKDHQRVLAYIDKCPIKKY